MIDITLSQTSNIDKLQISTRTNQFNKRTLDVSIFGVLFVVWLLQWCCLFVATGNNRLILL